MSKKLIVLIIFCCLIFVQCCNKSLCGSIVTKCLLTKSCKCDEKFNSKCYKECLFCLEDLYQECCPCFEFCPKVKISTSNLNEISHVEVLDEPLPGLFELLTEENDKLGRWTSQSFPVQLAFENSDSKKKVRFVEGTKVVSGGEQIDNFHANCNVAFISKCLSWTKCKQACISMGSSSYRWFHNGCCQCVSKNCVNYGIGNGLCSQCPSKTDSLSTSDSAEFLSDNEGEDTNENSKRPN